MTIKEEMAGKEADEILQDVTTDEQLDIELDEVKKKSKKQKPIVTFTEVKKYIKGIDFEYSKYKSDIIKQAESNDAPEHIINILLKLDDSDSFHYYYEIQNAFNKIQQIDEPKKEPTQLETIKEELAKQKEVCNSKENRIESLEEHVEFWRKLGWFALYLFAVLIPIFLVYLQIWITIASNSGYNLLTFDLKQDATGWVISKPASMFLTIAMVILYGVTYSFLALIWFIIWEDET